MLGYFDSNFYELGFHKCLIHTHKEQLHPIWRLHDFYQLRVKQIIAGSRLR